jgi:hypothetical protein
MGFISAGAIGAIGFFGPELWLSRRIRARQKAVLLAVPDTLDLLTISVRAGLSFDGALAKVVEKTHGPLSNEFRRALAEIRVGKVRRDALRDVAARTDVPSCRSSPSNCASSAASAPRRWLPRRRSRCSSRSLAASFRRCSSSSLVRLSS